MTTVRLRSATAADSELLRRVRNEPAVRQGSFDASEVDLERHQAWLAERLARARPHLYVVEHDGASVGVVRLDVRGELGTVSIALVEGARGRGLGAAALAALHERAAADPAITVLVALVRKDNEASRRLFRSAGYREAKGEQAGVPCWRFELLLRAPPRSEG